MIVAIELEVLGDTRQLWRDWLDDASRVLDVVIDGVGVAVGILVWRRVAR